MPDSSPDDLAAHLTLALVPGLGPKLTRAVLARFGTPAAVLAASADDIATVPMVGPKLARKFHDALRTIDPGRELALLAQHRVRVAVRGTPDYPTRLADIDDAPHLVYYRGAVTPVDSFAVGIVGSRGCTSYGRRAAETIAAALAAAGYTIVSGLARGIDAAAHTGALQARGRTIAVMAGGLSRIYPPEHVHLADEVAQNGALVAETPMTVAPQPGMFPARNRIISALSLAVVIIEANDKSGALITATHAAEQGREVYVVPGNVDSPASAGCLELIRKGARLVRHAADILEDLQGLRSAAVMAPRPRPAPDLFAAAPPVAVAQGADAPRSPMPPPPAPAPKLDGVERAVWDALAAPKHMDDLARELKLPVHELAGVMMAMEMSRLIRKLPGNTFERR